MSTTAPIRLAAPAAPPPPPLPPSAWPSPPVVRGPDRVLYVLPSMRGPGLARCVPIDVIGVEVAS